MASGSNRPRNWSKEDQQRALELVMKTKRVAYKVVEHRAADGQRLRALWLAASHNGVTMPYAESTADLVNVSRGEWEARHPFTGVVLAKGVSMIDVIRATINNVCQ